MSGSLAEIDVNALYLSHADWLRQWIWRHTRCSHRAADLAQDTFCRLIERSQLRLHAHPRRYLATVARRLLIDDARRRSSERHFLEAFALHMGDASEPAADRIVAAVEELAALALLLGELPERVRRAFLLSRIDGLPYAVIATELDVSTSMVKQYVARAFAHCYEVAHGCTD